MPSRPPKESALDKIAKALQIGQGVLGIGLAIPKYIQDVNQAKNEEAYRTANLANQKTASEVNIAHNMLEVPQGTEGAGQVGDKWYLPRTTPNKMPVNKFTVMYRWAQDAAKEGKYFGFNPNKGGIPDQTIEPKDESFFKSNPNFQPLDPRSVAQSAAIVYNANVQASQFGFQHTKEDTNVKQFYTNLETKYSDTAQKLTDEYSKNIDKYETALGNLSMGNYVGDKIAIKSFAKSIEGNRLSDLDMLWYAPNTLKDKWATLLTWADSPEQDIPANLREEYRVVIQHNKDQLALQRSIKAGDSFVNKVKNIPNAGEFITDEKLKYGNWEVAKKIQQQTDFMNRLRYNNEEFKKLTRDNPDGAIRVWAKEVSVYNNMMDSFFRR
jgi:hypothetical protein